jgi:acetoin utilization deacetylase AcuC-like enzyme
VLVVDCDVHQGNGTAAIFRDDSSVFTFSVHARGNFPFRKEESDLGIALEDGVGDEAYLDALAGGLDLAFARSRPDLVIYVSGADPFADDRLGRLAVSKRGLEARDRQVLARCRDEGVPVAVVMGGAYARRVEDAVEIHFGTLRAAAEVLTQRVRVA